MAEGFTLSESISSVLGQIGITVPGLGVPGSGGRGTFTTPRAPTPLTPEQKQQYNERIQQLEQQRLPLHIQPKLDHKLVPVNLARVSADVVDEEDLIDAPPPEAVPTPPAPTFLGVPLGVVFGVNAQGLAVALGVQGEFGFSPASPAFGWIDTISITVHANDAPTGVGAVPGAPGQGGTSATSDPTDSGPPGPGSPGNADGTAW